MGFKEARERAKINVQYQAMLGDHSCINGELRLPPRLSKLMPERLPIAGATAILETGDVPSRPTLTRIGAGALLAGPVGAIVGGLFKKDKSKVYVSVILADGRLVLIDAPKKDVPKAMQFVAKVNAAGVYYAEHGVP